MSATLIATLLPATAGVAVLIHMVKLEIQDRRDHRRFITNLRRINNSYPVYNDRNEVIGTGR